MTLIELAKEKFGDLTPAEERLFLGAVANFASGDEAQDDPENAKNWGRERTIRSDSVAWLCTDRQAVEHVTHRGVQIAGARIDGELNLQFARFEFPLAILRGAVPQGINLRQACVRGLYLDGTHTGPISADGLQVIADVTLRSKFKVHGHVRLPGVSIGGDLDCNDGEFNNPGGIALVADRARIGGGVFLRDGFGAQGQVHLIGMSIGGSLDCNKGRFSNPNDTALSMERARVSGSVMLRDGFEAHGEVRLLGTSIGGNLECRRGLFRGSGATALVIDGAKIGGDVFLCGGFEANREVRLVGASIGGNLECDNGRFSNSGGHAINADSLMVSGNVFLRRRAQVTGSVRLVNATVNGALCWSNIASESDVKLDLRHATIGILDDDPNSWPMQGRLNLHGLSYDELGDESPKDATQRIDWLRRQPGDGFRPQPYEQLASVLRQQGHEEDARQVLIAKEEDRAKHLFGDGAGFWGRLKRPLRLKWWWCKAFGPMIGYGHRPGGVLPRMIGFVLAGWLAFWVGSWAGLMSPAQGSVHPVDNTSEEVAADEYPALSPLMCSVDMFVPVVDLRQASYWLPNVNRGAELFTAGSARVTTGGLLRVYMWVHIAAGWVLSTLLVVGLSGVVRRQ